MAGEYSGSRQESEVVHRSLRSGLEWAVLYLALGCVAASPEKVGTPEPETAPRFGIVDALSDTSGCFNLRHRKVMPEDQLWVLFWPPDSAWVQNVRIQKRLEGSCRSHGVLGDSLTTYEVRFIATEIAGGLGLGVLSRRSVLMQQRQDDEVVLSIDHREYRVRQCTSMEGIHFIVKQGSRSVWREYYYLPYDVEPDCRDEDFEILER